MLRTDEEIFVGESKSLSVTHPHREEIPLEIRPWHLLLMTSEGFENFCWRLMPNLGKVQLLSATSRSPPLGMWLALVMLLAFVGC